MTLDDLSLLLTLILAAVAWYRACARPSRLTLSAALAATVPLLRD